MTLRPRSRQAGCSLLPLVLLAVTGCANVKLEASAATPQTLERLRGASMARMQAGQFALATGKPPQMDATLSGLRGHSLTAAKGSFAQLLKDTLVVELTAAGLYDSRSATVIEGELTDSRVDAAMGTGTARLAAAFKVRRDGAIVFFKELAVESKWESSFIGAVAVPLAMNSYHGLYKTLVGKLLDDPDFQKAAVR